MHGIRTAAHAARFVLRFFQFRPARAAWRLELGRDVTVEGHVRLPGPGRVRIGDGVRLVGRRSPVELRAHEGAEIIIESGALLEDGCSVEATRSVRIGSRARIGSFCKIIDNHFHRAAGDRRMRPEANPVRIGVGALVGPHAVILPGAAMADGSVLGAATALSFHLPAGTHFPGARPA
jgi:acetyltransferase-like isoleucine patch superfamily enzyme